MITCWKSQKQEMSFLITQCEILKTTQIYEELKKDEYSRKIFQNVLPFDCLPINPPYPSANVINTDPLGKPGNHLLSIFYDAKGKCCFFDSFGKSPAFYGLENYIFNTATSLEFNQIQLQSINSNTCGYYCIYFILLKSRNFELCDIINLFQKQNFNINDFLIKNIYP